MLMRFQINDDVVDKLLNIWDKEIRKGRCFEASRTLKGRLNTLHKIYNLPSAYAKGEKDFP